MKKSTLFMIVSVVLALTLSLGGTLAYLTDTDYDTNVMVLGNIDIEQHETDSEGKPFVQGQMLLPIVGSASMENGYTQPDNFIDKIVTVENVGNYDAYVRTFVAVPVYTYEGQNTEGAYDNVLHWKGHSNTDAAPKYPVANQYPVWEKNETVIKNAKNNWYWGKAGMGDWPGNDAADKWNKFFTKINGIDYEVFVATNLAPIAPGERTAPNLMGVYLDSNVDFNGKYYTYEGKKIEGLDGVVEVLVATQAVQYDKGWGEGENDQFAAFKALDTAFGAPSADNHPWKDEAIAKQPIAVNNAEELKAALATEAKDITVILNADVTYDVAAWDNNAMGGSITEEINIIGNGHTLNFVQKDSDWDNVVTNNGAKLVLTDVNVTNSGHNDGPWNRHDINFACDVAMNNVTSDKAFAFMAGAVLNNVTISDANTSDTYAIWIQPNGQTVSLDNCVIDMLACTDGRGIKIDEQYVGAPAKVTLNVANTVFKTEEKSAILVKSVAGADITLNNVDISAVAADSTNPVWVDEASAAYADLVTVTGGNKIVEH